MAIPNERISQYTKRGRQQAHQGHDDESTGVRKVYEQAEGIVRGNPGYSVMATFAMGLGLGLLLASMTTPKRRSSSKFQDYLSDNARETIQHAVMRFVPDAVSRFLSKHS